MPAQVAIYARVSDDKLTDEGLRRQDVQRQVEKLKEWANKSGMEIEAKNIFIDDNKSAFKDDYQSRPAFVKLITSIKAKWINRVLIEDMTRWSRRIDDGLRSLKETAEAGCTITSIHDGDINITITEGWARATMALFFSEWSARSQADKIRSGMQRRERDKRNICQSCGIVHIGRHPRACECKRCRKRKGRVENHQSDIAPSLR